MNDFIKVAAVILIVLVLGIFVKNLRPEMSVILVIAAGSIVLLFATINYISPVINFVRNLCTSGDLDLQMITTLIKATGIGMICEIITLICADAGFGALGKTLKFTSVFVILWVAIPLVSELLSLINKVLVNE